MLIFSIGKLLYQDIASAIAFVHSFLSILSEFDDYILTNAKIRVLLALIVMERLWSILPLQSVGL